jgi:hypothetical protein
MISKYSERNSTQAIAKDTKDTKINWPSNLYFST